MPTVNRLSIIGELPREFWRSAHREMICVCKCGGFKIARIDELKDGSIRSCGCLQRETVSAMARTGVQSRTHGMFGTPEYRSWTQLIQRCTNPKDKGFKNYGGRGIHVYPDWLGKGGFQKFYSYIGPRPGPDLSIDRIDNDGNYEPGNVRWATRSEQERNKRGKRLSLL